MERMLLYSVRTGNDKEVKSLKTRLMSARKMPLAAATLAELAGYLLDRGEIEEVLKLLSLAVAKDRRIPDSHYELARYYARSGPRDEERKALDNAILYFEALPAMTGKRTGMYIDSLLWRGKFRLEGKEWIGAEADFASAATAYEKALELKRLAPGPRFAEAYAGLAEVAYRQRNDLDSALRLLERAAANGFDTADARYKRGVILYAKGDPASALEQFYWAGRKGTESPYLLHALGAAFYARKDYSAAEGYFRAAAEFMRKEYETIDTPRPGTIASEAEVVELFMKAENNLGAALVQVAGRVGDARVRDRAALAFAEASRLFETLRRTGAAPEPSQEPDLGTLNMNAMIQPRSAPVIYAALARDMSYPRLVE
jgi:tetratricopeptide (TPR) repeat protein